MLQRALDFIIPNNSLNPHGFFESVRANKGNLRLDPPVSFVMFHKDAVYKIIERWSYKQGYSKYSRIVNFAEVLKDSLPIKEFLKTWRNSSWVDLELFIDCNDNLAMEYLKFLDYKIPNNTSNSLQVLSKLSPDMIPSAMDNMLLTAFVVNFIGGCRLPLVPLFGYTHDNQNDGVKATLIRTQIIHDLIESEEFDKDK